ncbi:MAG: TRAP transporter substrate-binding protein [Sulfuriferula multivorans]|uniref:TRAP transporter substrate-binding protein n=1 Tax=Sulfuriferula multivorans TaxID=1559896 RepID=A0A7C9JZM5_9PROT|nr:TRAP transporter substrate-binding protein [Sulfuriferula multivorans]
MNKQLMRKLTIVAAVALATTFNPAFAQVKWDLPSGYPPGNFHTENLQQFANDVDKATNGKLKITIHSNGSLFKANEIKRAVQGGQAQTGEIFLSNFGNEDPIFALDAVPFIANGYADAKKLWQLSKPATETRLNKQGLKVLYSVAWQPGGIYSVKPLNSAADLKGSKWRAYNAVSGRIAELVGAQPVTIQAAELSQALATGAVETFATSSATGYDSKAWEQVKYFYEINMSLPKNLVIVNQQAFLALDKPTQDAVVKAAAAAEERGWTSSEDKNKWYLEQLAKNGMKVEKPSVKFQTDLKKIGDTMLNEWLKQAGADGKAIIDAYRK